METRLRVNKPFLKWAGSKRKLIGTLKQYLPPGERRYVEPFVGSGAAFLNVDYSECLICDSNADLTNLYAILKANPEGFARLCKETFTPENNNEDRYYELRGEFNATKFGERRASLFVYLNRHCYNGLCRYNSRGEFNTPFGRYDAPYFPEAEMIGFAEKLQTTKVKHQDFRKTFAEIGDGDVVYCDPPYVPLSRTANFTDYSIGGFSAADQEELAYLAGNASNNGAVVLVSNHDTLVTRSLYSGAAHTIPVLVQRTISCDGENRKKTNELIAIFSKGEALPIRPTKKWRFLTGKFGEEKRAG